MIVTGVIFGLTVFHRALSPHSSVFQKETVTNGAYTVVLRN
jgi:hypothetical protein